MAKKNKRQQSIKSKLMAAICMLLVSSIMMVSSTYAWFTLSTAPEVTGINTAVGANGNLEMALRTEANVNDIKTSDGGNLSVVATNKTWGNLVNLKDASYGLDLITLYPAALNVPESGYDENGNPTSFNLSTILKTPVYGVDGRVQSLDRMTVSGTRAEDSAAFFENTGLGVRALGTVSGMTARELSYRNARAAANTAMGAAKVTARQTLSDNGDALANIGLKEAMTDNPTYTKEELQSILAMVNALAGTDGTTGALEYIEEAYIQYLVSLSASALTGATDAAWNTVLTAAEADGATPTTVINALKGAITTAGLEVPASITTVEGFIGKLNDSKAIVVDAQTELNDLINQNKDSYTSDEVRATVNDLADPSKMLINGYSTSDAKENAGNILSSGAVVVTIKTGGGVFADIADHCDTYYAPVAVDASAGGVTVKDYPATLRAETTANPFYLSVLNNAAITAGKPQSSSQVMPISDYFGYVIDLAFRTNAADSKLLLQQEGIDRIYEENEVGAEVDNGDGTTSTTMGGGAYMAFKSTDTSFSDDSVKELMKAIRIVFFVEGEGGMANVVATAKLDTENTSVNANGEIVAPIYIYSMEAVATTGTDEDGYYSTVSGNVKTYNDAEGNPIFTATTETEGEGETAVTTVTYATVATAEQESVELSESEAMAKRVRVAASEVKSTDNAIMSLEQNTATALSVLVYLDGYTVDNADVAATGSTSVTGTMNLQFSSSANLVPMEYADLRDGSGSGEEAVPTTT